MILPAARAIYIGHAPHRSMTRGQGAKGTVAMKRKSVLKLAGGAGVAMIAAGALFMGVQSGHGADEAAANPAPKATETAVNTGRAPTPGFLETFKGGRDPATHYLADYVMYADWIATGYDDSNIRFNGKGMQMVLEKRRIERQPFSGAEFQRAGFYGYGRYEVIATGPGMPGAVASFFTHTDGMWGDPHHEIDFEWLGNKTHEVQLNYYSNGQGGPFVIKLPFDASKEAHLYAFEWRPESIHWYIDGQLVHKVTRETAKLPLPTASGRMIANLWAVGPASENWAGKPTFKKVEASYACISHIQLGQTGPQCSDTYTPPRPAKAKNS
jgi:endo-1,3-1,4-beta-glycanase ExoK